MDVVIIVGVVVVAVIGAIGVGVKRRRDHNAEVRHYDDHKRRPFQ